MVSSINAQNVAYDISKCIRNGKKVILGEIILNNGYSKQTSLKPQLVTETKSFKKAMKPLADQLKNEIDRLAVELSTRDISNERYETVAKSLDILNKNYQLVSGGITENVKTTFEISEKLANRLNLNDTSSKPE